MLLRRRKQLCNTVYCFIFQNALTLVSLVDLSQQHHVSSLLTRYAVVGLNPQTATQNNCKSLQVAANGTLPSGTYTVQNSLCQSFRIYCLFKDGYGYTFLSNNTNVTVDMESLYDDNTHILVRFTKANKQYESTLAQINSFASVPLSIQYNSYIGYNKPQNVNMTPYIYVGFIPASNTFKYARQGWKTNGQEQFFNNCDANPNSYIMFMFNHEKRGYTDYVGGKNSLLYKWYDNGTEVLALDYVPGEFLTRYHEIHHGGCGGYSRGSNVPTTANVGMKFEKGNFSKKIPTKKDTV
ncbi:hypothetical protein MAR_018237 [Mya arenaria]|uniref:Uncharacterized protein n=1 Tax=Mya arenaria TaxID=6604 RepID=A0ABY7EGJ9_MYAAR|nr:hypothetical protein MAR_018237 [Mya arenaria]